MDEFVEYKSLVIPEIKFVRFYKDTFLHILENHPEVRIELPSVYGAIGKAIVDPSHVELSYGVSYVFVDFESVNRSGDPLRVPVKLVLPQGSARVRTAYFATVANPAIIWRRGDA